jgi:hypothetical protein
MAVKAKKAKVASQDQAAPVAVPQKAPQATTVVAGGMSAMERLRKSKLTAAPVKEKESDVPNVKVEALVKGASPEPMPINEAILRFLVADSERLSAENKKKNLGECLRPIFEEAWMKQCRDAKSFAPQIRVNGSIKFTGGQLSIVGATPERSQEKVEADLKEHFGKDYDSYVKPSLAMFILPEEKLKEKGLDNNKVLDILQEKLGDAFFDMFSYSEGLSLKKDGDKVVLREAMAKDPVVEVKVIEAIGKGLISKTNGALTPESKPRTDAKKDLDALEKAKEKAAAAKAPAVQVNITK